MNRGSITEDEVEASVARAFGPDFVFRSPRLSDGHEATDILVVYDDVRVVVEVKSQAEPSADAPRRDAEAWAQKALSKACRQVEGAIKSLRAGRVARVANARRGEISVDVENAQLLIGLVVLRCDAETFPVDVDADLHVLSFEDFTRVSALLDTPRDLVRYLVHRSRIAPDRRPAFGDEAPALDAHCRMLRREAYELAEEPGADDLTPEVVQEYVGHLKGQRSRLGSLIDDVIEALHRQDPAIPGMRHFLLDVPAAGPDYVKVGIWLARLSRLQRIGLGKEYAATFRRAIRGDGSGQGLSASHAESLCIVFFVARADLPREERASTLTSMLMIAQQALQTRNGIGIATSGPPEAGKTLDVVWLGAALPYDPFVEDLARSLFGRPQDD